MLEWLHGIYKRKEPIEHWASKNAIYTKYRTPDGDSIEVEVHTDPYNPAAFLIKSNGAVVGRFWLDELYRICVEANTSVKYAGSAGRSES